jgi:hypothetical protein
MNQLIPTNPSNQLVQQPLTKLDQVKLYTKQLDDGEETLYSLGRKLGLNNNQIHFVEIYMSEEYKGSSGRDAAAIAYGKNLHIPRDKAAADSMANKNLKHTGILMLINVLHNQQGFNDEWIDRQLKFIIDQNQDLKAKLMGIEQYNKLHQRIKPQEIVVQQQWDFTTFTPDMLKQFIDLTEKARMLNQAARHLPLLDENNNKINDGE